ncbi:hypothetical protein T484DRAFT_1941485, partial [Baffinella frigidus]
MRSIILLALLGLVQASPDAAFVCPASVAHRIAAASPLAAQRFTCPRRTSPILGSSLSGKQAVPGGSQLRRRSSGARMSATEAELSAVLSTAIKAGRAAGALMKEKLGAEVIKTKVNSKDLLTEIDPMCEKIIRDIVLAEHPAHSFLGEESVAAGAEASGRAMDLVKDSEWLWVVDPIDGTTNFVSGMPLSAVSIGVARRGELVVGVIVDPFRDEVFSAARGQGAFMNGKAISVGEEDDIGDAVIAAGSPPSLASIKPSLRGVTALMPKCRTIRMIGSAALHFAWIANGRLTAYWEPDLNSWDSAAG